MIPPISSASSAPGSALNQFDWRALLSGKVLLEAQAYLTWGGAVKAKMYLPLTQTHVWQQLTDYPHWVNYFPDLTHSQILQKDSRADLPYRRLYQAASKTFLNLSAKVEVYLQVYEVAQQTIQFRLEKGDLLNFSADLNLQSYGDGTLLTYAVRSVPSFPVPAFFIQQMMSFALPANMQQMRQVLCHRQRKQVLCS